MSFNGDIVPYDSGLFSRGSASGSGFCTNHFRGRSRHGPPVVAIYRTKVRDRWGKPTGGWWALCASCAKKAGIAVPEITRSNR